MNQRLQFTFILIGSIIASLGTYPYAKDFSSSIISNHNLAVAIAGIFVPAAVFANIALGAYSLQNTFIQSKNINYSRKIVIILISLLSAIAMGFICFVGYQSKLPTAINVLISVMVVIVNAGIGFSAINNALNDLPTVSELRKKSIKKQNVTKLILSIVTVLSALMVTLTAYFASTHGLTTMLKHFTFSKEINEKLIYLLAIVIWFPGAVLFANGSRVTVTKIYDRVRKKHLHFSFVTILIAVIAFASGSAYAQMALEFFNTCKSIPDFFKHIAEHYGFIFYFFMPIAFIISAVVNGYALDNLIKVYRKT